MSKVQLKYQTESQVKVLDPSKTKKHFSPESN